MKLTLACTPTKAGTYSFKLIAKNKNGRTASKSLSVKITSAYSYASTNTKISSKPKVYVSTSSVTDLSIISDDVISQGTGRDSDYVSVRVNHPVRFILGEWTREVSEETVYVNDEAVDDVKISEGMFTLPAEFIHDDFRIQVKAGELESQELYISAE